MISKKESPIRRGPPDAGLRLSSFFLDGPEPKR